MTAKKIISIFSVLAFGGSLPSIAQAQWTAGMASLTSTGLPAGSVSGIIASTLAWLLGVLGFIAVIAFVVAGIQYLLSAGDEGVAERAKNAMKYAIIGVIVALMGFVVILAVNSWLNASYTF